MALEARDILMLERAYSLAEKGRGCTSPNPLVGAVVFGHGRVLGEGYHVGPWRDHAEIAAVKDAMRRTGLEPDDGPLDAERARAVCAGTTMYVTLEPCCTYGRTPPCTSALVSAGFARVVVGAIDPTPAVNGRGIQILREADLDVDVAEGELARRMKRQNAGLRKLLATGMPFVTYKYAMTLDGRLSTDAGDSKWISGPESRALVHRWRAWSDAVMVGAGTQESDDPRLTAREVPCERQPLRVVVGIRDSLTRVSPLVTTADQGPVLLIAGNDLKSTRRSELESWGVEVAVLDRGQDGLLDPCSVASLLAERGVQTALLEGGRRLAGSWWQSGLVDKIAAFVCPRVAPGTEPCSALLATGPALMGEALSLKEVEARAVGDDVLVTGYTGEAY